MAKIFPLNQRSALNVTGDINRSHATVIDTEEEDDKTVLIDMEIYKRFWSLQSFFQNPQQVMGESWNEFIGVVDETLKTFDTEEALGDSQDQTDDATFVPKYLTSRKLLHLQVCLLFNHINKIVQRCQVQKTNYAPNAYCIPKF
jgi:THO complex subunit 1